MISALAALALYLTAAQAHWATYAYQEGAKYGEGATLSAIIGQESSYCKFQRNGWSRGCGGVKRSTARKLVDTAATRLRLESDNEYNIKISLIILLHCKQLAKTWRNTLLFYHYGDGDAALMVAGKIPYDPDRYIQAVIERLPKESDD